MTTVEILKELRGDRSQAQVAEDLGISVGAIGNYEAGYGLPKDEIKEKIAAYYHRSVAEIFFPDDPYAATPKKPREDKQAICDALTATLLLTRNCADLIGIKYDPEKELATVAFTGGTIRVNVAMDSGTAMIRDIMRQIP